MTALKDMLEQQLDGLHMPFYCYILECSDGTFYTGWTTDPPRREKQHNAGTGARYTRTRRPVKMVYVEEQSDKSAALKRELVIKGMSRRRKRKLMDEKGAESVNG
ncbi:MAG: GIY-YIG nuclease family protein [Anaerolineales bacterium]